MKIVFISIALLLLASCVHYRPVSDAEDAWVTEYDSFIGRGQLYYCKANSKDGRATPTCYPAAYFDRRSGRLVD